MQSLLEKIRDYEYQRVKHFMPESGCVLEIGAGAGWQAKRFHEDGYDVEAIDIDTSRYKNERIWPVIEYDGRHLPFPDASFDIVYSSSVLEHIIELEDYQSEIQRVLKPGGKAIHVVPGTTWRLWTTIAHYPYLLKLMFRKLVALFGGSKESEAKKTDIHGVVKRRWFDVSRRLLYSVRHGERGNVITEMYYFSPLYWSAMFTRNGWMMPDRHPVGIFYTGYLVFGGIMSFKMRRILARILGSSTVIYELKK